MGGSSPCFCRVARRWRRYVPLVTKGLIKLKGTTTSDLDRIVTVSVPDDVSPLEVLLAERADDDR